MCYDNICWTFVLTGEMILRISLHGTRGSDRERLLIRRKKTGITGFLCDLDFDIKCVAAKHLYKVMALYSS